MVNRIFLKCKSCQNKIILRTQFGHIFPIPIRFGCKSCGVVIKGEYNNNPNYTFKNADIIEPFPDYPADQENQISAELPLIRENDDPAKMFKSTPFLTSVSYFGGEKVFQFIQTALRTLKIISHNLANFEDLVSLYENRSYEPLFARVEQDFVTSAQTYNGDFHRATSHIQKIMEGFLNPVFEISEMDPSLKSLEKIFLPNNTSPKDAYKQITQELSSVYDISSDFSLGARLIIQFLKMFNHFIPSMLLVSKDGFSKCYGQEFYITSCEFFEVRNLFVDGFEILSRLSAFIFGLRNYDEANDVNIFKTSPHLTLRKYFLMKHGLKKDVVSKDSNLSLFFKDTIDNRLRNGICHAKTTYNAISQEINYFPFSDEPKITNNETIYLVDFTNRILQQILTIARILKIYKQAI